VPEADNAFTAKVVNMLHMPGAAIRVKVDIAVIPELDVKAEM